MKQVRTFIAVLAFVVLAFGFSGSVLAQESVGSITEAQGEIVVMRAAGGETPGGVGTPVYQKDSVFVGSGGQATIVFVDQTALTLRADSMLTIDDLVYDPAGQNSSASFDLAGGLMGLVSGDIVKTGNMTVTTPVSTIGIRGTTALIDTGTIIVRDGSNFVFQTAGTLGEVITSPSARTARWARSKS